MPTTLPENATPTSRKLYDLAVRLANACPPNFASEIALVGSAAMGLSDDQSDLDINFWVDTIPPEAERVAWLQSLGATEVKAGELRQDESYPVAGVLDGIDVGCSWQTFAALDTYVDRILQGEGVDERFYWLAVLTDVLVQAIPMRTAGKINAVQTQLRNYPDALRERYVRGLMRNVAPFLKSITKAVRYQDDLGVTSQVGILVWDLIEALYPINRRWHPQRKWRYRLAGDLPLQPPNLYERMSLALHDPDRSQRPLHLARLLLDTLALVKDDYDVSEAISTLEGYIKQYSSGRGRS